MQMAPFKYRGGLNMLCVKTSANHMQSFEAVEALAVGQPRLP